MAKFNTAEFRQSLEEAHRKIKENLEEERSLSGTIESIESVANQLAKYDINTLTDVERAVIAEIQNMLMIVNDTIRQIDEWIAMSPKLDTKTTLFANKLTAAELRLKAATLLSEIMLKLKELDVKAAEGNDAENIGISYVEQMHSVLSDKKFIMIEDQSTSSNPSTGESDEDKSE